MAPKIRRIPRCLMLCALLLLSSPAMVRGQAAATTLVEPPTPLLPTSDTLKAATAEFPVPAESSEAESILKEDGLRRAESRVSLTGAAGRQTATGWIKAYEFGDATGALAAYTYLRLGGRPAGAGRVNASEIVKAGGERVFLNGTCVVEGQSRDSSEAMTRLLEKIDTGLPKVGGRRGLAPLLPTLLPKSGVDAGAARYALGPVSYQAMGGVLPAAGLGWDKSLEIVSAPVVGKTGRGTLTLLLYPTPQIAGDRGRAIERIVNEGAGKFGTVKLKRIGPLVAMASGELSAERAQELVSEVKLGQEISFDQKMPLEFHAEVRKTASLLQNIAVLCGVLILAALLLGLFLGGARAGIRVLMGKPAASEPEFLTINLRDEGKPKDQGTA